MSMFYGGKNPDNVYNLPLKYVEKTIAFKRLKTEKRV